MPRFYCPTPIRLNEPFELPPDAAHHASRVLRLRTRVAVQLFDGNGNEYHGHIADIIGKRVIVNDLNLIEVNRESPLKVLLAQALSSSEKMDWVIQKATELGVTAIQPIDTERSVAKLSADRIEKRLEHWRQVAISSCEQCGRNTLPEILAPADIMHWLQQQRSSDHSRFILLPQGAVSLHTQPKPQHVTLLIGPEGGFTQTESDAALQCVFTPIRLGTRIMRTETAAIAGLAALQTLWGDFH